MEYLFGPRRQPLLFSRPDAKVDLAFLVFNELITKWFEYLILFGFVAVLVYFFGDDSEKALSVTRQDFNRGQLSIAPSYFMEAISAWPFYWKLLLGLLVADFFGYWTHRIFHWGKLWKYHAVHHSPEQLDWFSTGRVHPVDALCLGVVQSMPILLLGFDASVFIAAAPTITVLTILSHANVNWDFGPLRYFIISPKFHRWHHTSEKEGIDKNFAGLFPFYDIIFGTWYMPASMPEKFGAGNTKVPKGFWGQLKFPFARSLKSENE
ncbi:sterol desaturase family protein [Pseudoteredinibacter isoporae]|uniref:sterol desaturase family protein n=1 Tax=Pseudoteredinibacter isoporae TaxID=570281 RepID=UPI0014210231|nr:sterol desaturase family protein [Pseudoteredinibacter isoporae]NIB23512.1 sterol desaturase family protein [Pseudoteredinibacter isoporae]